MDFVGKVSSVHLQTSPSLFYFRLCIFFSFYYQRKITCFYGLNRILKRNIEKHFILFAISFQIHIWFSFKFYLLLSWESKNNWKLYLSTNCNEGKVPFLRNKDLRCLPEARFFLYRGAEERVAQELPCLRQLMKIPRIATFLWMGLEEPTLHSCRFQWNDTKTYVLTD